MEEPDVNVFNAIQRDNENELRCISCGAWLDNQDTSCGLNTVCVNCCSEPYHMHTGQTEEQMSGEWVG